MSCWRYWSTRTDYRQVTGFGRRVAVETIDPRLPVSPCGSLHRGRFINPREIHVGQEIHSLPQGRQVVSS